MVNAEELSCKELVELVTAYVEGALAPGDRTRFDAHLVVCSGCRIYLDQMRRTIQLTGTLTEASITLEAQQTLLDAFRSWKRG
jgi:predicted anti-sigma-YlaC factor YlaD